MHEITPFLWFDTQAEDAAEYWVSVFPESGIDRVVRYGEAGPGTPGSVMTVSFHLRGNQFTALNGGPVYQFSPATSFVVDCETQDEVDHYWDAFSEGGKPNQCGWIDDRYGVTWQIVPTVLLRLLSDPDAEKAKRVTEAMLRMGKLIIADLEAAAAG
jgi:predicted 3-demethylubiquinone-9 3-methyltransferase (glyoxalase superfamily)